MNSNIFCFTFDHDEWPSTHIDKYRYSRPYNGSIFELRHSYRSVFPEPKFEARGEADDDSIDSSKVYKVSYKINMLPMLGEYIKEENDSKDSHKTVMNRGSSLMEMCIDAVVEATPEKK